MDPPRRVCRIGSPGLARSRRTRGRTPDLPGPVVWQLNGRPGGRRRRRRDQSPMGNACATDHDAVAAAHQLRGADLSDQSAPPQPAPDSLLGRLIDAASMGRCSRWAAAGKGLLSRVCATMREIRDFNRQIYGTNRESVCVNRHLRGHWKMSGRQTSRQPSKGSVPP
eukprot:SAG31_NODE_1992_length_6709_cov_3.654870_10_plen_167_part_00